jgi:hypothetical protein
MFVPGSSLLLICQSTRRVAKPFGFQPMGSWNISMVCNPVHLRTSRISDASPQNLPRQMENGRIPRKPLPRGVFWWGMSWIWRLSLPAWCPVISLVQLSPHRLPRLLLPRCLPHLLRALPLHPQSQCWRRMSLRRHLSLCCLWHPRNVPEHGEPRRIARRHRRVVRRNPQVRNHQSFGFPWRVRARAPGRILLNLLASSRQSRSAQGEQ